VVILAWFNQNQKHQIYRQGVPKKCNDIIKSWGWEVLVGKAMGIRLLLGI
jgi:hypothetical protein